MDDKYQEINDLIELININIEKIDSIIYGEEIYSYKSELYDLEKTNEKLIIKEKLEITKINDALEKIKYSLANYPESQKYKDLLYNYENYKKILIYNQELRLNNIKLLKEKVKYYKDDECKFNTKKELIINILNSFIKSLKQNNYYYIKTNQNYKYFTAFVDNKCEVSQDIIEYFSPIMGIEYKTCPSFIGDIDIVKDILSKKDIKDLLISKSKSL